MSKVTEENAVVKHEFTRPQPSALRQAICAETLAACLVYFPYELCAIILTGSLARDEATFAFESGASVLRGDAEFCLVFENQPALPAASHILRIAGDISRQLAGKNICAKIDLSAVHLPYLRRLPPHIFSYELRECGEVIHGDTEILKLIPGFQAHELDKEDAWRLLCNRLIELLEADAEDRISGAACSQLTQYRIAKLYLDMATSLLVFLGAYAPTYRSRREAICRLAADDAARAKYPFPLAKFARAVSRCTDEKLGARGAHDSDFPAERREAIEYAHLLWRWELAQLLELKPMPISDEELVLRWMRQQPLKRKIRGWLYVAGACGWHKNFRQWPRWACLALRGSPRHWIYFVAAELSFDGPKLRDLRALSSLLPLTVRTTNQASPDDRRALAAAVAWNYHKCVTGTRA